MKRIAQRIAVLLAVVLTLSGIASACSCSDEVTVDLEFARTKTVVVVKAASYLGQPKTSDPKENVFGFKFTVQKVFKGKLKPGEEIEVVAVGMCSNTFYARDLGEEFLFYYFSDTDFLQRPFCSRSGPVKRLPGDISYLENMNKVRGLTRISGVVSQYSTTALEGEEGSGGPLKDHAVRITGMGRNLEVKTDEYGLYEVYGLPPGQYRIEPERIKGHRPTVNYSSIQTDIASAALLGKGHSELDFSFGIDNAISGRITGADGKPIDHMMLKLLPAAGKPREYFNESAFSEKDGTFRFEDIPAGKYVIVGNPDNRVTAEYPYPRFYSSGTEMRGSATEITIGPGEFLDGYTVKAPPPAETVVISGTLLFEDGSPVRSETVKFFTGETETEKSAPGDATAYTDQAGKFRLKILKGLKGTVYGSLYPNTWVYRACLDRLNAAKTKAVDKSGRLETPRRALEANADSDGLELRFGFSLCGR